MVQSDKVEVYITRHKDDRRFKEYRAPIGFRTYSPDLNEVYIEAVNDERFTVCVRLLRGFDWKGCANVQVKCTMDGKSQVGYIRKKPSNKSRELRRLLQLASIHQTIGGETVLCGLTFRELDIDYESSMTTEEAAEEEKKLGCIAVQITRGRFENARVRRAEGNPFTPPDDVDVETNCQKVIKVRGVTHALKHVRLRTLSEEAAAQSHRSKRVWTRAAGDSGKRTRFTIRYRSNLVLRVFGMLEPGDNSGPYESEADPDVTTGSHDKGINGSRKNLERRETGQNQVLTPTAADGHSPPKRSLLGDLGVNGEDNEVKSLSKRRIHHKPRSSQVIILTDSEDSSEGELVGQGQKKPVRNGNAWPQQSTSEGHEQRRKRAHSEIKREEEALDREEETFMKELKRRREEIAKSKRYVDSC